MPRARTVPTPDRRIAAGGTLRDRRETIPVKAHKSLGSAFGRIAFKTRGFERIEYNAANPLKVEKTLFEEIADHAGVRIGDIRAAYVPKTSKVLNAYSDRKNSNFFCIAEIDVGGDIRYLKIENMQSVRAIYTLAEEVTKERDRRKEL